MLYNIVNTVYPCGGMWMDAPVDVSMALKKTRTEIIQRKKILRHSSNQRIEMY